MSDIGIPITGVQSSSKEKVYEVRRETLIREVSAIYVYAQDEMTAKAKSAAYNQWYRLVDERSTVDLPEMTVREVEDV